MQHASASSLRHDFKHLVFQLGIHGLQSLKRGLDTLTVLDLHAHVRVRASTHLCDTIRMERMQIHCALKYRIKKLACICDALSKDVHTKLDPPTALATDKEKEKSPSPTIRTAMKMSFIRVLDNEQE
jgi:hypothetical protein